jgi:nicotinamide-nucleotide amidase
VLIRERLVLRAEGMRLLTRIVRVAGRTESHVEMAAQPLYERWREKSRSIEVTILAAPGTIDLHLTVRVRDVALGAAVLDAAVGDLREVFAEDLYSANGQPMEEVLGGMLREGRHTIAVAESCTGGLLSSRLTDVPGSSVYLDRAVVAYSNEAKIAWLGVGADLIAAHGAVSEPVAEAMAAGIRARADTTIGVAVTGIAGPGGGTPEKPVGTVAIAVEGPWGRSVRTRRFSGHREQVKWHASSAAMDDVRRAILRAGRAG